MSYLFSIFVFVQCLSQNSLALIQEDSMLTHDDYVICDIPTQQLPEFHRQGFFVTESLSKEGFIHCAKPSQLQHVMEKYFTQDSYALFVTDRFRLAPDVVYEGKDPNNLYPHLRRAFTQKDLIKIIIVSRNAEGKFEVPEELTPRGIAAGVFP